MFASLFKDQTYLGPDLEAWHLETWAWLMRQFGGVARLATTPTVLPNRSFFPPTEADGHARAEHIFACVKRLMGMADWPCALEPRSRPPGSVRVAELSFLNTGGSAAGTFEMTDDGGLVTYAEDLADDPMRLVATLAHELSHYRLRKASEPWPGGFEAGELTTELTVAYHGLAVFNANTAFAFAQHQDAYGQGWGYQRNGYFSPRGWAFALTVFLTLKGEPVEGVIKSLKPELVDLTKSAVRYLAKRPQLLEPLRAIG